MTDFTTLHREPFCLPLDIWMIHKSLTPEEKTESELLKYCDLASQDVATALRTLYADSGLKAPAPWAGPFFHQVLYMDPDGEMSNPEAVQRFGLQDVRVLGATVASTAFSQQYTVKFTSATAFTVTGNIEGGQGTGSTASEFTTSNSDVVIATDAWVGTFEKDMTLVFGVYTYHPTVVQIASELAAGRTIRDVRGSNQVEEDALGRRLIATALAKIRALQRPDAPDGMRLPAMGSPVIGPVSMPYDVDALGRDISPVKQTDIKGREGEMGGLWGVPVEELL